MIAVKTNLLWNIIAKIKLIMAEYTILIVCTLKYGAFGKTYSFLVFFFLINKGTGLAGSRLPFFIRIHTPLQINWFTLISINLRVKYFYRTNEITGCFFCRNISSIYSKRFWGNFRTIPRIYKCESFAYPLKFINQLWILNKFFITVSNNLLNLW